MSDSRRCESSGYAHNLRGRHRLGSGVVLTLQAATAVSILVLAALLASVLNQAFGPVLIENAVEPGTLAVDGRRLEDLAAEELVAILRANLSTGLLRRLESERPLAQRERAALYGLVVERVVQPHVVGTWSLSDWVFAREAISEELERRPGAWLEFRAWLTPRFLASPQSSVPEAAGVRTAVLGSLWVIVITLATAFPIGVGAAVYLEEYARDNPLSRLIQTNIDNLAGVPSIIYGMLGLALFVRRLEHLTSGALFGLGGPRRTGGRCSLPG